MDEARLIEKLRLIEALFAGTTIDGERIAADKARQRILKRLEELEHEDPPIEYRFSMADMWSRRIFLALLRRYGLNPYRYRRQRHTTVMVRVSRKFVDETLWPEFEEINGTLRGYLLDVTERVVAQVLQADSSDAAVVVDQGQPALPPPARAEPPVAEPTAPPPREERTPSAAAGESSGGPRERRRKRRKKKRR